MIELIIEQAAIKSDKEHKYAFDYWTIDLDENDLEYNPEALCKKFIGQECMYLGYVFKIEGVDFYSLRKDKIVLVAVKQCI